MVHDDDDDDNNNNNNNNNNIYNAQISWKYMKEPWDVVTQDVI